MRATQETVLLARRAPADPRELRTARVAHLLALTQFERALTACHLPIPPPLQREARLLRRLLA
jgi:hypothetical protein